MNRANLPARRSMTLVAGLLAALLQIAPPTWAQDAAKPPPPHALPSDAETATAIDAMLAPTFKAGEPGATVIVTRGGKVVYRKAFGMADVTAKTALKPEDVLRIGSLTKQFTAAAILLLAERGALSVNDPITQYLTDYPKRGEGVTIAHLLTHTSGIPSYTSAPDYAANMAKAVTVDEMISRFKDRPLNFKPGSQYEYSNSGYFLLGAIIEKVSGQRYADFVAKEIFIPLGLADTAYEGVERSPKRIVKGYLDATRDAMPLDMSQPYAAGSLISTVDDLAKWDAAISAGKLLKPETWKRAMQLTTLADGSVSRYGYGWGIRSVSGVHAIAHSGGINGFLSYAIRVPEHGVYVAVLTNRSSPASSSATPAFIAERAAAIAIGKPIVEPKAIAMAPEAFDRYAGSYALAPGVTMTVWREAGTFFAQATGQGRVEIAPESEVLFFARTVDAKLRFETDADGKVARLVLLQGGRETKAPRNP